MGIDYSNYQQASALTGSTQGIIDGLNSDKSSIEEQKQKLTGLFSATYFNSTEQKAVIDTQIKQLEQKIEEYEKKIAEYEEAIGNKEGELKTAQQNVADQVLKISKETESFESVSEEKINNAVELAMEQYRTSPHSKMNGGEMTLDQFMTEQLGSANAYISNEKGALDTAIDALADPQSKLSALVKEMEQIANEIKPLEAQYGTAKSTLSLLNMTYKNMTDAAKGYKSASNDPSVPIFTPEKAALADSFLGQYTSRFNANNAGTSAPTEQKTACMEKWKGVLGKETEGLTKYYQVSTDNQAVVNLGKAIENGMLEDMEASGMTREDILNFFSENYPSLRIGIDENGNPSVPYGHKNKAGDTGAKDIFDNFVERFNKIDSNPNINKDQVKEMNKAINEDKIIDQMVQAGFSWKECAYTLQRLFPGIGMGYNLGDMAITIPNGGTDTSGAFNALATAIENSYGKTEGVKVNRDVADKSISREEVRTDPIGINIGNNSYDIAIDRNGDNSINDASELAGGNGTAGIEDIRQFDADGDGVLSGEELNHILMLHTNHGEDGSVLNYEYLTAAQLGIESIDLNSFQSQTPQDPEGGINRDMLTGTFNVKMKDGKTAQGYQKDVASDYMDAVYKHMFGEKIGSSISGDDINKVLDESFGAASDKLSKLNEFSNTFDAAEAWTDTGIQNALRKKLNNAYGHVIAYKNQVIAENNVIDRSEMETPKNVSDEEAKKAQEEIDAFVEKYGKKEKEEDK